MTDNRESLSNDDQLLGKYHEEKFEICFQALLNSSLEDLKSTLKNASLKERVNLTLYNIHLLKCHTKTEETKKKRPKLVKTRMETWQLLAIVGFVILLVTLIIVYRLYVSKKHSRGKILKTTSSSPFSFL